MLQDQIALQRPSVDDRPPVFVCLRINYAQTVRIFVAGELDLATVTRLDDALRQAEADAPLVVLDLRRLEFVAACGVKLVVEAAARIREAGGRLCVVHAPDAFHRLLRLLDLTLDSAAFLHTPSAQ